MSAHRFSPTCSFCSATTQLPHPGGTLAIWTASSYSCHPHATPHAENVQSVLFELKRQILWPFELPGNWLRMGGYEILPLPCDRGGPVAESEERTFVRMERISGGRVEWGQLFLAREPRCRLDDLAKGCSTTSMVVRWRAAHKEQMEDCVDATVRRLKEALDGQDWMERGPSTALLMIKKRW